MKNLVDSVEYKPSFKNKIQYKINDIKYWLTQKLSNTLFKILHKIEGKHTYHTYALHEFEAMGWINTDQPIDEMQQMMCNQLLVLLDVFSNHNHSGSSAPYAIDLFKKLAMFKPLGPLTGKDTEWGEPFDEKGTVQNNRCSHVFKDPNGQAYDIDGKIFREPNGMCYTSGNSRVNVTFPYYPKSKYVDVPATNPQYLN